MPAKAGIQHAAALVVEILKAAEYWVPTFAGTTYVYVA